MENKEIYIDGVDVSKCIYFQQEDDEYTCGAEECNGAIVACRACDNCYYKQLKRKEQECEELKIYIESNEQQVKEVETLVMDNDRLINELDQLKLENKHLNDLLNQALEDIEAIQNAYEERE